MTAQNASQQMPAYRLSRRSMLVGLAGFTSLSALLAACGTESGNSAGATPTIASTSTTPPAQSPSPSPHTSAPIGTTLYEYHGHILGVYAVAWSPDSSHLAYASSTSVVESWEMPSGQHHVAYPRQGLRALQGQWLCLDWSRDGTYLAAGSYDGLVQIWNAQTTTMIYTRHVNRDVQALAWSPNRPVIASSEGTIVRLWQAA